jgi:hypothetical protein
MQTLRAQEIVRNLGVIRRNVALGQPLATCLSDLSIDYPTFQRWARVYDGRRLDSRTGDIQPWYTHPALDEIQGWDLRDQVILEWGGGFSTFWWARRCDHIFTIEADILWYRLILAQAARLALKNVTAVYRPLPPHQESFCDLPAGCVPNIVVIDGPRRLDCLRRALSLPHPFTLIFDNWQQEGAFMSNEAEYMMAPYRGVTYVQPDQVLRNNPWQTAIWDLI